jgi:hypothetical protein
MKKPIENQWVMFIFADRTGLEPATSAVTGRHSNQLNYRSIPFWDGKYRIFSFLPKFHGKKSGVLTSKILIKMKFKSLFRPGEKLVHIVIADVFN